jgi:RHS repeat-associated protein
MTTTWPSPPGTADSQPGTPAPTETAAAQPQQDAAARPLPAISAPRGGGALRGLGEKFSVAAATGTGSFPLTLPLSPGRDGFGPALSIGYDSGHGNGLLGIGWVCAVPEIVRKTDKGLPQYRNGDESDVFLLAGEEDLVPVLDAGDRRTLSRTVHGVAYTIAYYRPRVESAFARIERWTDAASGRVHWRTLSRDNVTSLYGVDPASTIADPDDLSRVFAWRICRGWDDKGNAVVYEYISGDDSGVDKTAAHEANRSSAARVTQRYLKTISYGNAEPYLPDWTATEETPLPTDWLFSVAFDYGDRPDPFSTYRSGFEVRTGKRLRQLQFFHNFPGEPTAGTDCLVRTLDFTYQDQNTPPDPAAPVHSLLVAVTETAHRPAGAGNPAASRSLPPLEFGYSTPHLNHGVQSLDRDSLGNLPEGLDGRRHRFADLDGEGCSGILSEAGSAWYYKRNLSPDNLVADPSGDLVPRARFGPMETVAAIPVFSGLSRARLQDLSGANRLDVVDLDGPTPGYYERTEDGEQAGFSPLRTFAALPRVDWNDPNVRFLDVTGDGIADVLMTEDGVHIYYPSLGGPAGFGPARLVRPGWDEARGPAVILSDGSETVFTADMSGDGLADIVRLRDGETCYWPNLGHGRFGPKVTMDAAPRFEDQERFDPGRIRLADLDGTGVADLLYLGATGVRAWFNRSGNSWSAPTVLGVFPAADQLASVQVLDLLGTGTACLAWSSPLPGPGAIPLRYIDLLGSRKPYLLTSVRTNMGAETRIGYVSSTRFSVADRVAGRPWATRLPFPVQVVERCETIDWIGRNRLVNRYAYHHGHYDGFEREYRGFGMVERWDTEEFRTDTAFPDADTENWDQASWSPPMLTRTWFHTGVFTDARTVSRQFEGEYWTEPALRAASRSADAAALRLPDSALPPDLDPFELQEAYRALKGRPLRTEVYGLDGGAEATNPYTVTEQNFTVRRLQQTGQNRHAAFHVHERESVTFDYERGADDPRVGHRFLLEVDAYGSPLRSVSVAYPRRAGYSPPEPALDAAIQQALAHDQARLHVMGLERGYTNAVDDPGMWPDAYRAPLAAGSLAAELSGPAPKSKGTGVTALFSYTEIDGPGGLWPTAWTTAAETPYEEVPASDVDGWGSPSATPARRPVKRSAIRYRSDDLSSLLPLGVLQPKATPGQSYTAAMTAGQMAAVFGSSVTAAELTDAGYVHLPGSPDWWIPSERVYLSGGDHDTPAQELAAALVSFFRPRRAVDALGGIRRVDYDAYALLPAATTDQVGNVASAVNDYRVLAPATVTDPNGNRVAFAFDVLGQPTATAVMGKTTETVGDLLSGFTSDLDEATLLAQLGDPLADPAALLGEATTRTVYDIDAYQRTAMTAQPSPCAVYTLSRETHVADLAAPPYPGAPTTTEYEYHFAYYDGFGREIQRKARVAPGPVTDGGPTVSPRWAGSGWTILDNKGRPVREYEPFFSATPAFEFAAKTGVSTVLMYDPPGRVVATLYPDGSWEKTVRKPWLIQAWDRDDTVLISDPRIDPDAWDYFQRLLGTDPFTSWYQARVGGSYGATPAEQAANQAAAQKAATAAATPTSAHLDALARSCLAVADNGGTDRHATRTALDSENKPLALVDALGRRSHEYCLRDPLGGGFRYVAGLDMADRALYALSADAGARRSLPNALGFPLRGSDSRGHVFRSTYDAAHRPIRRYLSTDGGAEILIDLWIYGEGQPGANLRGREFRHYDTAGYTENSAFDFKGNALSGLRQLASDPRHAIDWKPLAGLTDGAALDTAAQAVGLTPSEDGGRDGFRWSAAYDALNRPIQQVTPHNPLMRPNVLRPGYDEGGLPSSIALWPQQAAAPGALLDPATAERNPVTAVEYNARGQRIRVAHGNGTVLGYDYAPQTFRLARLTATRPAATFPVEKRTVRDLSYFYDPMGNVTRIQDDADTQNVVFFKNQRVEPSADYTYDALYRLTSATGREHLGQTGGGLSAPQQPGSDDSSRVGLPQPGDGNAMGVYTESYTYDVLDNILSVVHHVGSAGWTRHYASSEPSRIVAAETGNRLSATSLPGDPDGGPYSARYSHDPHGNMTQMPHLPALTWDEQDRLRSTTRQVVAGGGTPQTTYYVYDGEGQRVRKVTERQAAAGMTATRQSERIALSGVEVYREYEPDGVTVTLERETLNVQDAERTVLRQETRTAGTDVAPGDQARYQYGNQLGSAVLELDDASGVLTYEEYFPFGATSYQAVTSQTDLPKRYRYTGREHDTENDLAYHGARYYAPWLGRWTACDPEGTQDGPNLYCYVRNRPIVAVDPNGRWLNILIGAAAGFVAGGGFELGRQLIKHEKLNWGRVGSAALGGTVAGAIGGATMGMGLVVEGGLGAGVGSAIGGLITRGLNGEKQTWKAVGTDFAAGVAFFGLFKGIGAAAGAVRNTLTRAAVGAEQAAREAAAEAAATRLTQAIEEGGPKGGNKAIGAVEVEVPGYEGDSPVRARSGPGTPAKGHQNMPHADPVPKTPGRITHKVRDAPGEQSGSRAHEAEDKLLTLVEKGLPENATGTIRLMANKIICPNCILRINQFQNDFPGIDLQIFAPGRSAAPLAVPVPPPPPPPPVPIPAAAAGAGSQGSSLFRLGPPAPSDQSGAPRNPLVTFSF